jgi:hypothetical protein
LNSDVNTRIAERPTVTYFKKVLAKYDLKIEAFNKENAEKI